MYSWNYDWHRAEMLKATLAMLEMDRKAAEKAKR